jgi:hypothetical protein
MLRNGVLLKAALCGVLILTLPLSAIAKTHWYQPQPLASVDEASNRLQFFSPHFAPVSQAMGYDTLTIGYSLQRVEVSKLGINLSFTKSGATTHTQYFWTWGGGYNAPVTTPYQDDIVTQIVFADVAYFEISHNDKAAQYPANWCADTIHRGTNRNSTICVSSAADVHGLIDALATLAVAYGGNVNLSSGMAIRPSSDKDFKNHPERAGLEVFEVDLEGPPAVAGIQEKDVIRTVNGTACTKAEAFLSAVGAATKQSPDGGVVRLEILRNSKPMSVDIHYPHFEVSVAGLRQQVSEHARHDAAAPPAGVTPAPAAPGVRFGFQVRAVSDADVATFGLTKPRGIVVLAVDKGGLADVMGIQAGDVILEVNNSEIGDVPLFVQFVRSGEVKKFRVWRKGQALELVVPQSL